MTRRAFQSAFLGATLLRAERVDADLNYLALEAPSNQLAGLWPAREWTAPVSFGSLLKPFLVLAYGRTHAAFPVIECRGASSGCWSARGHGRQTLVPALAHSCNPYFLALARAVDYAALRSTCLHFGLVEPGAGASDAELIGLRAGWPQAPAAVVEAFHRLVESPRAGAESLVLEGMRLCAARGTANGARIDCFAKTGTAPCHHRPAAPGDGYAVLIYPVDLPRVVLLATKHGTTGAHTAALAGTLLHESFRVPLRTGEA